VARAAVKPVLYTADGGVLANAWGMRLVGVLHAQHTPEVQNAAKACKSAAQAAALARRTQCHKTQPQNPKPKTLNLNPKPRAGRARPRHTLTCLASPARPAATRGAPAGPGCSQPRRRRPGSARAEAGARWTGEAGRRRPQGRG
jgi:hypothetical protein